MSDQPKPTGEWTGMRILSEFQKVDGIDVYALADAIKAALDAEREKREAAEQRAANYHRQILDENEMTKQMISEAAVAVECLKWLREELKNDEYFVEKIDIAFAKVKEPR